jgi:hypothetical protein
MSLFEEIEDILYTRLSSDLDSGKIDGIPEVTFDIKALIEAYCERQRSLCYENVFKNFNEKGPFSSYLRAVLETPLASDEE